MTYLTLTRADNGQKIIIFLSHIESMAETGAGVTHVSTNGADYRVTESLASILCLLPSFSASQ